MNPSVGHRPGTHGKSATIVLAATEREVVEVSMRTCSQVTNRAEDLAAAHAAALPPEIREHLTGCPRCRRKLAAARVSRRLLDAVASEVEPRANFPDRVVAAAQMASARTRAEEECWRLGWRVVPAFGMLAATLFFVYRMSVPSILDGVFDTNDPTSVERLVLEGSSGGGDMVLQAMLGGDER